MIILNVSIMKCGGILIGVYKRFFGNTALTNYIPNIGRIHLIFYGQK